MTRIKSLKAIIFFNLRQEIVSFWYLIIVKFLYSCICFVRLDLLISYLALRCQVRLLQVIFSFCVMESSSGEEVSNRLTLTSTSIGLTTFLRASHWSPFVEGEGLQLSSADYQVGLLTALWHFASRLCKRLLVWTSSCMLTKQTYIGVDNGQGE